MERRTTGQDGAAPPTRPVPQHARPEPLRPGPILVSAGARRDRIARTCDPRRGRFDDVDRRSPRRYARPGGMTGRLRTREPGATRMYSDLIIGFDRSPPARDALALARRLALATGAHPMVLYVRPRRAMSAESGGDADRLSGDAGVEAKLDAARGMLAGVPGATFAGVADGSPARALHRAASDADAGLIVLGATHRTGRGGRRPGATRD